MDIMANPIGNNQFDFSKYKEGFREYQKQNPLPLEPEAMIVASNLPGIGNLGVGSSKQLSEYLNMVAPDYYNQYLSANKRNGPFLGSLTGDINFLQQTENVPSATNLTPISDGSSISNNQFDFSKYAEGFREYQKQNPISLVPAITAFIPDSNVLGIGRLRGGPEADQFEEYMKITDPDFYNQYVSEKRNSLSNLFLGDNNNTFNPTNPLQQKTNIPSITNITPIGVGSSMGSINANNTTSYNSLLQTQFPVQSIFNTISPANNQIQSSQQNGISQTLQPISQAQSYQLPPTPQPVSAPPRIAVPEMSSLPKMSNIDFAPQPGMPGYAPAFQPDSPYSATNLPEFMKDYQQTPSGKFVMSQGILGMPPQIDKVQSLFSQGYAQEYQPLEQKFQESFAFDPSMFGNIYRSGQLIPGMTPPDFGQPEPINPAAVIAGAGLIKEAYPYAEDAVKAVVDPVSGAIKNVEESAGKLFEDNITKPVKETIESAGNLFEENITQPVKETVIDPVVTAWQESQLKKSADQRITDLKKWADDTFDKPEFINNLQEGAKQYIKDFKDSDIIANTKIGIEAIGNLENFISKPTAVNAYDAVDSIDQLNSFLPENLQFKLPGSTADVAATIGATLSVGRAIKDPSVENIANAYAGIDELAFQAANQGLLNIPVSEGSTVLPEAGNIGNAATIIGGVKALEGGIESPGEAIAVANAAIAAGSMATAGAAAGTTAFAVNQGLALAGPVGAAIAAAIALEEILAEDMSLKDVMQSLPFLGRTFGGGGSTFGTATLGYDGNDFSFVKESSKKGGWEYTMPEMHSANLVLNELTDNLGFELDESKLKGINTTIDIDKGNVNRGANDIVLDMINTGAIKPTANTPNDIDWANLFTTAREYSQGRHNETKLPVKNVSQILNPPTLFSFDPFNFDFSNIKLNLPDFSNIDLSGMSIPAPPAPTPKPAPAPAPAPVVSPIAASGFPNLPDFLNIDFSKFNLGPGFQIGSPF